ncbi:MFS general substrate transporter [Dichomitus squalens LYAD-421 SS1]|uniref:MFS general substrate transporter n=1 Tax=Dichomitus squalens (strain LYAD-421) TaxID=732165 RepID=R7SJL8_DICSQ|nr:MFS general substrate transporter [Dichomitus squalens LYAD-421 SS1]EJF56351.1 MFS general substrate transporter [Dichomitus squalens LYAD-421 SS1]
MAALRADDPQEGANVQELAPVDRGIQAWTFCGAGFVLEMMVWGFGFSYGIFQEYYTSNPPFNKESPVAIAAVGTVCLAIEYGEIFFLYFLLRKYPDYVRLSMWCGLAIYSVSLFTSSFATRVWQLILLQGIGVGVGGGVMYMPIIYLLPQWFSERRGLAGGIIYSGIGVGGFVFPLILNGLLSKLGLSWTLRIWAIGSSICSAVALLGMRPRLPVPKFNASSRRPKLIPNRLDFFKTSLFWSFAITTLLQGLAHFPVSLYIATFARALSDQLTSTVILSLFNASAFLGQIVIGYLTDRIPYPSIMVFSALGSSLGAFLLWGLADRVIYLYFFAIVFGSLSGGFTSTWTNASYECAGSSLEFSGMVFSSMTLARSVSAVVGPIISGVLLEAGADTSMGNRFGKFGYGAIEIFVGSCALATGVGSVAVAIARQRVAVARVSS